MTLVTKGDDQNEPMDDDDRADDMPAKSAPPSAAKGGFFHIYKSGQGYWTRLGTALGVGLLILLVSRFLYVTLETRTGLDRYDVAGKVVEYKFPVWKASIVGTLVLTSLLFAWKYINGPTAVDFLIATESEMKKVNWTSRKDLFGSTKVVIIFMFLIAAILFVIDVAFGYFFFLIKVLKTGPFA